MGISIHSELIYQLFDLSDPLSIDDIQKIERYLDENTGDFFKNIKTDVLIGAAGSGWSLVGTQTDGADT